MRHFLSPTGRVGPLTAGVVAGSLGRPLVALARLSNRSPAPDLGTLGRAVDVAVVAPGTDVDLETAAGAQEQSASIPDFGLPRRRAGREAIPGPDWARASSHFLQRDDPDGDPGRARPGSPLLFSASWVLPPHVCSGIQESRRWLKGPGGRADDGARGPTASSPTAQTKLALGPPPPGISSPQESQIHALSDRHLQMSFGHPYSGANEHAVSRKTAHQGCDRRQSRPPSPDISHRGLIGPRFLVQSEWCSIRRSRPRSLPSTGARPAPNHPTRGWPAPHHRGREISRESTRRHGRS